MSLLSQVLRGPAEVAMVKLVLQSTAEVPHFMVAESRSLRKQTKHI